MKLVKFGNGTFGVRVKRCFFTEEEFIDIEDPDYRWPSSSSYFSKCQGTEKEARATLIRCNYTYKIVKD